MKTMILRLLLFCFLMNTQRTYCNGSQMDNYANALKSLDTILKSYDPRNLPRPQSGNGNVTVETNAFIRSIHEVDEHNMEFTLSMTLRQQWLDRRLAYDSNGRFNVKVITLKHEEYGKKIWMPDTFLRNDIKGNHHEIVEPNNYIRIFPDGKVLYSVRITTTMSCPMDHHLYPIVAPKCSLYFASYSYQQKDLRYVWKPKNPVQLSTHHRMKSYSLSMKNLPPETRYDDVKTSTGTYSVLAADFVFNRHYSYDVLTIYVPWIMIIVISWSSFWIDPKGPSSVVRFMIVTICLFYSSYNGWILSSEKLPKVSYTKMIDVWTGICVTFHFFTFKHSVLVHYLTRFDKCDERKEHGKAVRNCRSGCCSKPWHEWLDVVARIVYPALFVVFASFYWIHMSKKIEEQYGDVGLL